MARRLPRPVARLLAGLALTACFGRGAAGAPAGALASDSATLGLELAPDPALQRLIDPRPDGRSPVWLGGDVAASVEIAPERAVWLFGDTIVGRLDPACSAPQAGCRHRPSSPEVESSVLANSAGTMRLRGPSRPLPIVKQFREIAGKPAPIFAGAHRGELWWPLAAARVGRTLLVAVSVHRRASGLVPLENLYVRVRNPGDPPRAWVYDAHPVPNAQVGLEAATPLTWTTALVPLGEFVYAFGQKGVGFHARTVLSRMRGDSIGKPGWRPRPEYLVHSPSGGDPVWSDRFALESLQEIDGLPGTSEATFERSPELGWVTFQIPPLSFEIRLYTADELAGPWHDRGVVYRVPPPWSTTLRTDCWSPEAGCGQDRFAAYAAKSHPELAPPGGFALTYNVNLLFGTLAAAVETAEQVADFYVPQAVAGVVPARSFSEAAAGEGAPRPR